MRSKFKKCCLFSVLFISVWLIITGMSFQDFPNAPKGIVIGSEWDSARRELTTVFPNQDFLDLGENGVRTVQLWTEIINCSNRELTWIVEYETGLKQEILTQRIRYDRFRTYLEKTFRRNVWNKASNKSVDVSGECRIMIIDKSESNAVIVEKKIILH
ncbi:hypothetical protein ACFL6G_06810 [candidate division KSB1 bacterium]